MLRTVLISVLRTLFGFDWSVLVRHWRVTFAWVTGGALGLWWARMLSRVGWAGEFAEAAGLPVWLVAALMVVACLVMGFAVAKCALDKHFPAPRK